MNIGKLMAIKAVNSLCIDAQELYDEIPCPNCGSLCATEIPHTGVAFRTEGWELTGRICQSCDAVWEIGHSNRHLGNERLRTFPTVYYKARELVMDRIQLCTFACGSCHKTDTHVHEVLRNEHSTPPTLFPGGDWVVSFNNRGPDDPAWFCSQDCLDDHNTRPEPSILDGNNASIRLDGVDEYVTMNDGQNFDFGNTDFSVSSIVRHNTPAPALGGAWQHVTMSYDADTGNQVTYRDGVRADPLETTEETGE